MLKNVLITGYRAHELQIFGQKHEGIPFIKKAISSRLTPLVEDGLEWVLTPGQYGVDLWACEVVLELKKTFPDLKLSIITAFQNPEEQWKEDKQEYYRSILQGVDYYGAISRQPYIGPWQFTARDDLLLRKSDGLLLVYDEDAGDGSPRFIKEKAVKKQQNEDYTIISITSEDIQSVAEDERMNDVGAFEDPSF
ncbi:DUF1273 domain-containing protein [Paenibacillus sp. ALJ109b]|uniref:DUF1273 domain-containing protein n=1 Tax=Paenibacillus sp. ALJ109b TaxID=2709068 RepID=UPI001966D8C5|nr:DUF1273 domain-containing protein [Paenibacillus sp. ALJ109b]